MKKTLPQYPKRHVHIKFQNNPSNGCGIKIVNGQTDGQTDRRTDRRTDDGRQGDLITSAREV